MKFIGFILGVALVIIGFYLSGFDFNTRGEDAVAVYVLSLIHGVAGAIIGGMLER